MNIIVRLKAEPAVVIGALAAAVVAVVRSLGGSDLLGTDVVSFVTAALDPAVGGWAIPLITGIVTRFFVSPVR